ncbi:TPM domain-containing protein [soil metagenome]
MNIQRLVRHWLSPRWVVKRAFTSEILRDIRSAITEGEQRHDGEVRFAVEGSMPWSYLSRNAHPRERAVMAFSKLRVWDTARNTGVLVYVNLADRDVEVVADRGIAHRVGKARWELICAAMEQAFAEGRWRDGALAGVAAVNDAIAEVAPPVAGDHDNEVPDRPVLL